MTIDDWTEILKRNNNFDAAYIQIGKALYRQGKYEESMNYFKSAYETENYSLSYKEVRKQWANKYFWMIPIVIVVVCILLAKFFAGQSRRTALAVSGKSSASRQSASRMANSRFLMLFPPFLRPSIA